MLKEQFNYSEFAGISPVLKKLELPGLKISSLLDKNNSFFLYIFFILLFSYSFIIVKTKHMFFSNYFWKHYFSFSQILNTDFLYFTQLLTIVENIVNNLKNAAV
jgi:hypothetical protein